MKTALLTPITLALTLCSAGAAYAAPRPAAMGPDDFQRYVADIAALVERLHDPDPRPTARLRGVEFALRSDWSNARFRVYHRPAGAPATEATHYVVAVRGARAADRADWPAVLRTLQAASFPVKGVNPLVAEPARSAVGWVGWGYQRMVFDYLVGGGLGGPWADAGGAEPAARLLDDVHARLDAGEAVEIVVTGHGIGAGASWLLADYLKQHFDDTRPAGRLHIRSFAFNGPAAVGAGFARRFAESLATPRADGTYRLQAFAFTRRGDIVSTLGSGPGAVLHPAVWAPAAGQTVVNAQLGPVAGAPVGHCTHLELDRRSRLEIHENHGLGAMTADLLESALWRAAAECMVGPADGALGFRTYPAGG